MDKVCLTPYQTNHIYEKIEEDSVANLGNMSQEMEEDGLDREDCNDEVNPYKSVTINDFEKD